MASPPETQESAESAESEAIVEAVALDVAHDSDGLLMITLRFPNGALSKLPLEGSAVADLLRQLDLDSVRDLTGLPFSRLAPALPTNLTRSAD